MSALLLFSSSRMILARLSTLSMSFLCKTASGAARPIYSTRNVAKICNLWHSNERIPKDITVFQQPFTLEDLSAPRFLLPRLNRGFVWRFVHRPSARLYPVNLMISRRWTDSVLNFRVSSDRVYAGNQ